MGQSQTQTNDIFKAAEGKVLIIDEAYSLNDGLYGKQVIDVIVEKVQGDTDDRAVLLLGYEEQIMSMIRDTNPGLARRFPLNRAFKFEDYTDRELKKMWEKEAEIADVGISPEVTRRAVVVLSQQRKKGNFGNAGALKTLFKEARESAQIRKRSQNDSSRSITIIPDDIPGYVDVESTNVDPFAFLDKLVGLSSVRATLQNIYNKIVVSKREGEAVEHVGAFLFRGPPGTGKTTVARGIGSFMASLGIISNPESVQTNSTAMKGSYLGQTKDKVYQLLDKALGGILFIDEAYDLVTDVYGREAVTTLVDAMTSEKYGSSVIIIFAGYPEDMERLLSSNDGLRSRIRNFIDFPPWKSSDCVELFLKLCRDNHFAVVGDNDGDEEDDDDGSKHLFSALTETFQHLLLSPKFGNARDVVKLFEEAKTARYSRVVSKAEKVKTLTLSDLRTAIEKMVSSYHVEGGEKKKKKDVSGESMAAMSFDVSSSSPAPSFARTENVVKKVAAFERREEPEIEEKEEEEPSASPLIGCDGCKRDAGVSDADWQQLEDAKRQQEEIRKEEEERRRKIEEEIRREEQRLKELMEQKRLEEARRIEEEMRKKREELARQREKIERERKLQEKLQRIGNCPAGFEWIKVSGGYRCSGGSHHVSQSELDRHYSFPG